MVAAVNKMDLVSYAQEVFYRIREEFVEFAEALSFHDIACIPISALKGDMVVERGENLYWYDGPTLLELLETIEINHNLNLVDFRFPVQWVCRPGTREHHDFRGYMGRIESSFAEKGDRVTVMPSGRSSRIKHILMFTDELERAFASQPVTLLLDDDLGISRGDMIIKSGDTTASSKSMKPISAGLVNSRLTLVGSI